MNQQVASSLKTIGLLGLIGGAALTVFGVKAGFSAARVEELGFALNAIAKANKISQKEVDKTVESLRGFNIAHDKALEITSLFIQSELDLTDATKLATVAKDLAVLASLDSSQATKDLTRAIVTQRPILLKQFGIQKGLVEIYDDYADSVGKVAGDLTQAEKKQAFLNTILKEGKKVAGTYEAAMGSVSKRFRSLTGRIIPDFMALIGKAFQPALTVIIDAIADSIANLSEWAKDNQEKIAEWGKTSAEVAKKVVSAIGTFVTFLIKNKEIVVGVLVAFAVGIAAVAVAFVAAHAVIFGIMAAITVAIVAAVKLWNSNFLGFRTIIEGNIKGFLAFYRFIKDRVVPNVTASFNIIKDNVTALWNAFKDKFDLIKKKVVDVINFIKNLFKKFTPKINIQVPGFLKGKIPGFQTGGIVPGPIGQPQPAIVHGGEEIKPLGASGGLVGGGITLNVNIGTFIGSEHDKRNLAEELMKQMENIALMQGKNLRMIE